MKRREFIRITALAAVSPFAAHAQQPEQARRVGVLLALREDDPETPSRVAILNKGWENRGWALGQNIRIDYRWAGGDAARARAHATELVGLRPDVIIANSTLCLKAVLAETSAIPVVFVVVGDPVGQGFVTSLARPGGNITGFTAFEFEIGGKWLTIIKEVAPDVRRVAFMFNPNAGLPYAEKFIHSIKAAAPALGVEVVLSPVHDADEIDRVFVDLAANGRSGLIVNPDAFTSANRGLFISLAARHRLPAIYAYRFFTVSGGLLSYGHEHSDAFAGAAIYVDRILRGTKPADLPVQNPTKFELIVNQKTARDLGLTIPEKLLALADEVIE